MKVPSHREGDDAAVTPVSFPADVNAVLKQTKCGKKGRGNVLVRECRDSMICVLVRLSAVALDIKEVGSVVHPVGGCSQSQCFIGMRITHFLGIGEIGKHVVHAATRLAARACEWISNRRSA